MHAHRLSRRQLIRRAGLGALGLTSAASVTACAHGRNDAGAGKERWSYGDHPDQVAELFLPDGDGTVPVAVVIHGGFWTDGYGVELATPLAADLAAHGVAALALEYRRVGGGGGWPATGADVGDGVDSLATAGQRAAGGRLDLGRVVAVGHSAGAQLAVWAAGSRQLGGGGTDADIGVPLTGVVGQAGVLDLRTGSSDGLGGGAVDAFLGGSPNDAPDAYAAASPVEFGAVDAPVRLVHGDDDQLVPLDESERYLDVATEAGGDVRLTRLAGVGHFEHIDPDHPAWATSRRQLLDLLGLVTRPNGT